MIIRETVSGLDVTALRKGQGTGNGTEYENSAYLAFQIDLNRLSAGTIEKYGFLDSAEAETTETAEAGNAETAETDVIAALP